MSANSDVAVGIQTAWTAANLSTGASPPVPGGLHVDPLPHPRPPFPYAVLTIRKDPKPNWFQTDGQYWDFRRAKIVLYGIGRATLGGILTQILAGMWKDASGNWVPLVIPNAAWLRTEYVSDEIDIEDPVQGEDVRSGPIEFIVWSQRKVA